MSTDQHRSIKAYFHHGVIVSRQTGEELICNCVLCDKENHLYINQTNGKFSCKHCGKAGALPQFLAEIFPRYAQAFLNDPNAQRQLVDDRGIRKSTFRRWNVGLHGDCYTIPVETPQGVTDLRWYQLGKKEKACPGADLGLAGSAALPDPNRQKEPVYILEGAWDAMVMDEILHLMKLEGIVLEMPGAEVFKREWVSMFQGRDAVCLLDHDDAGRRGSERIQQLLSGTVKKIQFLRWPELKSFHTGFDVRDLYTRYDYDPAKTLKFIQKYLGTDPPGHSGARATTKSLVGAELNGIGLPAEDVVKEYRKWLHMPDVESIDVVFGAVFANRLQGDPLWLFLVAPPGASKSALLMALDSAPLIMTTSSLTPHALISGSHGQGGVDPSLLPQLDGQVLVVKDFTTLLGMNEMQRDEIFATLRDAYDGKSEKVFGNGVRRKYKSHFGLIAGVTPAVQLLASVHSALGERFLRYRIRYMSEASVARETIGKAISAIGMEEKMQQAMSETAAACLNRAVPSDQTPRLSQGILDQIIGLARWVGLLRGTVEHDRYSGILMYKPSSEVGTRLGKQLAKLAYGIALFHREPEVTPEIYQTLTRVARETCPDRAEALVRTLFLKGAMEAKDVARITRLPQGTCSHVLEDLRLLRVVGKGETGTWDLQPSLRRLMEPLNLYEKEKEWLR